jgi:arylsulfatase A-like enzyme
LTNILLITLDQWRGDALGAAGHPIVQTPHLDRLAREGVWFSRHYSQAAPCGPGRASLYTGLYQMNHRVVANGAPLDARFDNLAHAARRAGYAPALFGYTDQAIDPREAAGPDDPRLSSYEQILPGFDEGLHLPTADLGVWIDWVRGRGADAPSDGLAALATEPERPAELSHSAFMVDQLIAWIGGRDGPWFAHLSQLRPHPPYAAAGRFAALHHPDDMPDPIAPVAERSRLHEALLAHPLTAAPKDPAAMRQIMAQYFGMIAEADFQLGRLWASLQDAGQWNETFILVTSDHGEQLGDHGLIGKSGFFEQSFHVPCLVRGPGLAAGRRIEAFTENVDVFPTLAEVMGLEVPAQCDGRSLGPWLRGEAPDGWRDAAHWEFDWRSASISRNDGVPQPWDRRLERRNLAALRTDGTAYVQFGDGAGLAFDLAADPTWRTPLTSADAVLPLTQAMLAWRAQHADRTLSGMLTEAGGVGRWPPLPDGWSERRPGLSAGNSGET